MSEGPESLKVDASKMSTSKIYVVSHIDALIGYKARGVMQLRTPGGRMEPASWTRPARRA